MSHVRWWMISRHPISDLSYIRCHTGAYYSSGWDLQISVELCTYPHLRDVRRDDDIFTIFTMIPQWSLSGVAQLGLHFSTLICHHAFLPGDAPFDLWVWFNCKHRWLGSRMRWGMIWAHLIFRPATFWCHAGAYSPFRSRFVDPPLIRMITLGFEIHLRGASLEYFSQIHVFWYSRDFWTELS